MNARPLALISLSLCLVIAAACSPAPLPTPSATSAPPSPAPTSTPVPTAIPPTSTPAPTATLTPVPIILTNGTNEWILKSATLSDTSQYALQADYLLKPGYQYLTLEFGNEDGGDLISEVTGMDLQGSVTQIWMVSGLAKAYVTDKDGKKYHAVAAGVTYFVIPVPEGASGFTLHVADMAPIDIGE